MRLAIFASLEKWSLIIISVLRWLTMFQIQHEQNLVEHYHISCKDLKYFWKSLSSPHIIANQNEKVRNIYFRENEDVFLNETPDTMRKKLSRYSSQVQLCTPQHSFRFSSVSYQSGTSCHQSPRANYVLSQTVLKVPKSIQLLVCLFVCLLFVCLTKLSYWSDFPGFWLVNVW